MTKTDSLTGQLVGSRYRFGERVASDENFEIYAATQSLIARPVLIQIAREVGDESKDVLTESAKRMSAHDQLAVARPIEVGAFKRRAFVALDAGGAEPLSAWKERDEASAKLVESWASSMLGALHQIHAAGLRLERPEQQPWLLGADGRVWLLDAAGILEEGPRANSTAVVRTVLSSVVDTSEDGQAALDRALAETPKLEPSAPAAEPTLGRVKDRWVEEWRRTPVRARALGFAGIGAAVSAALLTSVAPTVFDPAAPSKVEEVRYVLPRIQVTRIDPELEQARAAAENGDKYSALKLYRSVAERDAEQIEDGDVLTLVSYLDLANAGTRSAGQSLEHVGLRAEPALRSAFRDQSLPSYHRRRAGEVLQEIGARADLVPLWIEALASKSCPARRLAAAQLARSGDRRALKPLEALADKDGWFRSFCGADEAEIALERLSDQLNRS